MCGWKSTDVAHVFTVDVMRTAVEPTTGNVSDLSWY